jgi:hypothetical protein
VSRDKFIEIDELEEGDEVEFDPQITIVKGFTDLVAKLDALIQGHEERVRADLARNQTQLEVLATLQATIRKQVNQGKPQIDLEPLKTVLTQIQEQHNQPRPAWEFEINRDNRGFMTTITAKPQGQQLH